MTEPTMGLPVWRPGTAVRYWLNAREGKGEIGLTQGSPFMVDGTPVVFIAGHDSWLPLARVEALDGEDAR
jgi:hypothetical protein